jgi:hypothetical protein
MAPQNVEAGALVESQGGGHEGGGAKKKIRSTLITQKKAKFIGLCLVDRNSPLSLCRSQGSSSFFLGSNLFGVFLLQIWLRFQR